MENDIEMKVFDESNHQVSVMIPPPPIISKSPTVSQNSNFPSIPYSIYDVDFSNLSHNSDGIAIKNCPNIECAYEMLTKFWFLEEFHEHPSMFAVKVEIESNLNPLSLMKVQNLVEKLNKNRIIILFENFLNEIQFLWKFCDEKIFSMKIHGNISNFLMTFLIKSLKIEGHSGVSTSTMSESDDFCDVELHSLVDARKFDLLMIAAEQGDASAVTYLLGEGFDVNNFVNDKAAVDLAWDNKHYNIVAILLKDNSMYPVNYNSKEATDEIKNILNISLRMHDCIRSNNLEAIKEIILKNLNLRHFYTINNLSAPAKAAMTGHIEIYKFLISQNVFIGPKEDIDKIIDRVDQKNCEDMRGIHLNHIQHCAEKHLMILTANSFVGHDIPDVDKKLKYTKRAFSYLNQIHPSVSLVLKVVAASRDFKIIFDFNRDSVRHLDPSSLRATKGVYYTTRHIYVGAKQLLEADTRHETYGTLAHELCHYAMNLVYNNQGRPYYNQVDNTSALSFMKIVPICENNSSKEPLINYVFNYLEDQQHAELIVRVPHMIAEYSCDALKPKLEASRQNFAELYDYFENVVVDDMENSLSSIEVKADQEIQRFAHRIEKKRRQIFWLWILAVVLFLIIPMAVWMGVIYFEPTEEPIYVCANLTEALRNQLDNTLVDYQGQLVLFKEISEINPDLCEDLSSDQLMGLLKNGTVSM